MADVITRFKLETTQFDSKLRDSAQSLSQLTRHLQIAGNDFDRFAQQHVEAARSFGQVTSGATNLKDKLKDLVGAYNQVAKAYNELSQDQKQTDFGKAMADSLQQLQERIRETKSEMNAVPGVLDKLKERFTVNIDAVKMFNIGLKAAEGVMKVAKDAFFNNEEQLDEWGRTVESCESLYKGFLNSINTGDISGFLSNIDQITQAARDAYNALDELATFNAFNKANIAGARADLSGSIADYREGKGSKEDVGKASEALIKELETRQKLQREAYEKVIAKVAAERQVSADDLLKVMTGKWGTFKELKDLKYTGIKETAHVGFGGRPYYTTEAVPSNDRERLAQAVKHLNDTEIDNFQSLAEAAKMTEVEINNQRKMVARVLNGRQGSGGGGGGNGGTNNNVTYAPDSIAYQEQLVSDLTKKWKEAGEAVRDGYAEQLGYAQQKLEAMKGGFDPNKIGQIADLTGRVPTVDLTAGVKLSLPELDLPDMSVMLKERLKAALDADQATLKVLMQDAIQNGIDTMDLQLGMLNEKIKNGVDVPDEAWQKIIDQYNELRKSIGQDPIEVDFRTGGVKSSGGKGKDGDKKEVHLTKELGSIVGGVNGIVSGIEQLGVELPQGLKEVMGGIQGMISILTSISTIISAIEAINAADAIIPFARGGVVRAAVGYEVPGNHFSGDMVPALLNSGETVLNRAQSGIIASALEGAGGGFKNGQIVGRLEGEKIVLVANRFFKRTGQGEILTWRN